jgi:REP element-mobilizing transposase RayT
MIYQDQLQSGYLYHIYNRGNHQEALFKEEKNYFHFLDLYRRYIHQIAYLYAYCLLPTHFHLLVRIKDWERIDNCLCDESQLGIQFRTFLGTYTKAINQTYNRSGHLFEGRYSRKIVLKDDYFFLLIVYIHQNPQNCGIVLDYKNWPFSSYDAYSRKDRRSLVAKEVLFDVNLYNTIMEMHDVKSINSVSGIIKGRNGFL